MDKINNDDLLYAIIKAFLYSNCKQTFDIQKQENYISLGLYYGTYHVEIRFDLNTGTVRDWYVLTEEGG